MASEPLSTSNLHKVKSDKKKNNEVLKLCLVKGFQCHSNYIVAATFWEFEKKKHFAGIISQFGA